jgi:dipeptidyl aminopeptidase/acylaminoacyl peptidase
MSTDRFVAIPAAQAPQFARDGRTLYFLAGSSNPQVAALDLAAKQTRTLSAHDDKVWLLRRAPKDDRLIYAVDQGGDERHQLHLFDPATQTTRALTSAPDVIHQFGAWSPDGTRIAYACNARDEAHLDVQVMDLASGAARTLAQGDGMLNVAAWSPDGATLAVTDERSSFDLTLRLIDVESGAARIWPAHGKTRFQSVRFTPDGAALLLLTDSGSDYLGLARFTLGAAKQEWLYRPDCDLDGFALSPDGARIAVIENVQGAGRLVLMDADGANDRALAGLPEGVISDPAWSADGAQLAFTVSGPTHPTAIWVWREATNRVARLAPSESPAVEFAPAESAWFTTHDERWLHGFLVRPPGEPPARGFPAIVWVHGGPEHQTRANFRADMQMLAASGFAVFMPNVRGSTGYGRKFAALDDLELRPESVRDLKHAHEWLVAQPGIDRTRIGIMGQSYGGFMVLAAISEYPELWRAAVDYYGVANFQTLLATTGPWRRRHRAAEYGDPVRDAELLRDLSPIHRMDCVAAPLLLLHGRRDPRVPFGESGQVEAALCALGKPVEFLTFDYAGHGFTRAEDRARVYRAVAAFFTRHLGG